jgi:hypothetical protein
LSFHFNFAFEKQIFTIIYYEIIFRKQTLNINCARLDYTKCRRVCSRRRKINYTLLDSSRPYESIYIILEVILGQLENSTFFDLISRISIRALFNK